MSDNDSTPNTARWLATLPASFSEKLWEADRLAVDREQDWKNEATVFTFADGSKASACYPAIEPIP